MCLYSLLCIFSGFREQDRLPSCSDPDGGAAQARRSSRKLRAPRRQTQESEGIPYNHLNYPAAREHASKNLPIIPHLLCWKYQNVLYCPCYMPIHGLQRGGTVQVLEIFGLYFAKGRLLLLNLFSSSESIMRTIMYLSTYYKFHDKSQNIMLQCCTVVSCANTVPTCIACMIM